MTTAELFTQLQDKTTMMTTTELTLHKTLLAQRSALADELIQGYLEDDTISGERKSDLKLRIMEMLVQQGIELQLNRIGTKLAPSKD